MIASTLRCHIFRSARHVISPMRMQAVDAIDARADMMTTLWAGRAPLLDAFDCMSPMRLTHGPKVAAPFYHVELTYMRDYYAAISAALCAASTIFSCALTLIFSSESISMPGDITPPAISLEFSLQQRRAGRAGDYLGRLLAARRHITAILRLPPHAIPRMGDYFTSANTTALYYYGHACQTASALLPLRCHATTRERADWGKTRWAHYGDDARRAAAFTGRQTWALLSLGASLLPAMPARSHKQHDDDIRCRVTMPHKQKHKVAPLAAPRSMGFYGILHMTRHYYIGIL